MNLVATVIEYPLAKRYPTVPPTGMLPRMLVAGGMTLVAVLVAQKAVRVLESPRTLD